ncbi:capsid protein [Sewage-associated circular DNA virus-25]|uniref:capsid protein n=1 Tax=Sewage-associated circular DNA virus-25 TaxID=1592092 RepID=UPI00058619F3|nr:capsid protein [Sewage-associated circular DNA virus-25]AJD07542.1 capsid protein [Sewage-associated circular DNA virus-25]
MARYKRPSILSRLKTTKKTTRGKRTKYRLGSLGGAPKAEVKSFDTYVLSNATGLPHEDSAGFAEPTSNFAGYTCLNEVSQGAAFYARIGSKISIKSIQVDFDLYTLSITTTAGTARCILIYDRQTNGAAPSFVDMFNAYPAAINAFGTGINMTNRSRFSIIRDKYYEFGPGESTTKHVHMYAKGRWDTEYKSSTPSVGDITTGAIYLSVISNISLAYSPGKICMNEITARIRYLD